MLTNRFAPCTPVQAASPHAYNPGIEVRPIHQMSGASHFNEVFFSDVRVRVCGLDADALPPPSGLRKVALKLVSDSHLRRRQGARGMFLFVEAENPD